jgi:cell shape-determining protein MreC
MITSFRHDKEKIVKRRKLIALFFLFAVIVFLVRGPVAIIGRPFWSVQNGFSDSVHSLQTLIRSKLDIEAENTHLKDLLAREAIEGYSREALREENDELKAKLGRSPEFSYMLTQVLASPPVSPYDTFIIDVGEDNGSVLGMDAFTDGDFKVGTITRVWKRSSLVTLSSAPESTLSVTVGSNAIPAVARGVGGGNFRITLPKGVDVKIGDLVNIPALAPMYAGIIMAIDKPEGSSLESLFISLPLNIFQTKYLYLAVPIVSTKNSTSSQ